jgi:hypothetical protein
MGVGGARPGAGRKKGSKDPKLKKGTAREKVGLLNRSFDLSPYLRAYDANEKHPAYFLSSYTDNAKLRRAYDVAEDKFR